MKKNIKKGLEKLPLLYQLSETIAIANNKEAALNILLRPNRFIKMEVYESVKTSVNISAKPITKIL